MPAPPGTRDTLGSMVPNHPTACRAHDLDFLKLLPWTFLHGRQYSISQLVTLSDLARGYIIFFVSSIRLFNLAMKPIRAILN